MIEDDPAFALEFVSGLHRHRYMPGDSFIVESEPTDELNRRNTLANIAHYVSRFKHFFNSESSLSEIPGADDLLCMDVCDPDPHRHYRYLGELFYRTRRVPTFEQILSEGYSFWARDFHRFMLAGCSGVDQAMRALLGAVNIPAVEERSDLGTAIHSGLAVYLVDGDYPVHLPHGDHLNDADNTGARNFLTPAHQLVEFDDTDASGDPLPGGFGPFVSNDWWQAYHVPYDGIDSAEIIAARDLYKVQRYLTLPEAQDLRGRCLELEASNTAQLIRKATAAGLLKS
ncbi:MAG: hypothetical protein GY847_09765 [Proteobacteria bacterium]|nr:hypothetical protein [Pseudomonadota bacterium]